MTGVYVLLVFILLAQGTPQLYAAKFDDLESCLKAKDEVHNAVVRQNSKNDFSSYVISQAMTCLPLENSSKGDQL